MQNEYLLAKVGADTAENERDFAEICQKLATCPLQPASVCFLNILRAYYRRLRGQLRIHLVYPAIHHGSSYFHFTSYILLLLVHIQRFRLTNDQFQMCLDHKRGFQMQSAADVLVDHVFQIHERVIHSDDLGMGYIGKN